MNASAIWSGEFYAFVPYKGRNKFYTNARKGRCLRVVKEPPMYGQKNGKTYAYLEEINPETGNVINAELKVAASDVIEEWTAYENERDGILREQADAARLAEERRQQIENERAERFRVQNEQRELQQRRENEQREKLVDALVNRTGIPKDIIQSVSSLTVTLDKTSLEFWLSIPDNRGGMSGQG